MLGDYGHAIGGPGMPKELQAKIDADVRRRARLAHRALSAEAEFRGSVRARRPS